MVSSIFKDYIVKYFNKLTKGITEKVNDKEGEIQYEHKKYLKKEFSTDMKWQSLSSNTSVVAADVVALDSELPLKKRGSHSSAEGEVPKLGMKKSLTESALQALENLKARGNKEMQLVKKLFSDAADGVKGVYERLDIMFLQALSSGVTLINDENNTGVGIRIDFGIPSGNQFGVTTKWDDANATPITDIDNVTSKARSKGHSLKYIWMDAITFNAFKMNAQVKSAFAGFLKVDASYIFRLKKEDIMNYLMDEYGLTLIVIDKVVQIEKGGAKTAVEPWTTGNVTFTTTTDLGTLTYGELAEVNHPVKDVEYSTVDDFILVSLYRTNDPLKENTSVQALAIPVLDNVESIYIMDTNEATAAEDTQTEGDANYDYKGTSYTKQSVVDGINAARAVDTQIAAATINQQDATLAKKIDALSEEGIALFEAELVPAV
ncbi:major capsid protein [Aestuariibaculum marinum]|uniref:Major capsid protein n=1 Tax=Aestuariibaculum marinum TaxID=2683592 RepID=A0A8J6Q6S6_9FLAO|nr:major capsid protein [Aestuariibaculum marinum]MBD0822636.1 major capsid protein [Aestuariibaculum marinum]